MICFAIYALILCVKLKCNFFDIGYSCDFCRFYMNFPLFWLIFLLPGFVYDTDPASGRLKWNESKRIRIRNTDIMKIIILFNFKRYILISKIYISFFDLAKIISNVINLLFARPRKQPLNPSISQSRGLTAVTWNVYSNIQLPVSNCPPPVSRTPTARIGH